MDHGIHVNNALMTAVNDVTFGPFVVTRFW